MSSRSEAYLRGAGKRIVGGSSSPARDTRDMGVPPPVLQGGLGSRAWDIDGRVYLDYLQSFGPGILGHGHPGVEAVTRAATGLGPVFGTHHPSEGRLAEALSQTVPRLERVRFVASGTEAVMSCVRLARAATGRTRIVKFDAGYHGHSDAVLGHTGSAAAHAHGGRPDMERQPEGTRATAPEDGDEETVGVPPEVSRETVTLPWNDARALQSYMARVGRQVACVLVEPVAGNIGIVRPEPDFVAALNASRAQGSLLIADEVVSAFRFRYGDASTAVGLLPDLFCLGKIIGGGFPVGAYGGGSTLMGELSPEGPVFQAGTFAGHPVAMGAGVAALHALGEKGLYDGLADRARRLADGLLDSARSVGVPCTLSRVETAFTLWPGMEHPVRTLADVQATDAGWFASMYRGFRDEGILLAPSRYEAWFVTIAHDEADIAATLDHAAAVFGRVRREHVWSGRFG